VLTFQNHLLPNDQEHQLYRFYSQAFPQGIGYFTPSRAHIDKVLSVNNSRRAMIFFSEPYRLDEMLLLPENIY
jgi:hypothetical protein